MKKIQRKNLKAEYRAFSLIRAQASYDEFVRFEIIRLCHDLRLKQRNRLGLSRELRLELGQGLVAGRDLVL